VTKAQVELIGKCVRAVRYAQKAREANDLDSHRWRDYELVEVGWINGVNPRTADSLVRSGVLVTDMPFDSDVHTNTHVRLPRLDELPN
jgi:hypothetical protein